MRDDSLPTLALLGGAGAVAGAALAASRTSESNAPRIELGGAHVVPLPMFGDYSPAISNEWNPAHGHFGVDFMYARRSRADLMDAYPPRTPNGSRDDFMPDGVSAVAAADGVIRFADRAPRGWTVILDHADGTSTYYTHLEMLSVNRTTAATARQRAIAGQPLGVVGFDPLDGERLKHLHFELWLGRTRDRATNPAPHVARWARVRLTPRGNAVPEIQILTPNRSTP